jgi:hypothetical protein
MALDDRTHQELIALQALASADIAFFKNQQWQAAYYGSLLYAAIVFIPQAVGDNFPAYGFFALGIACFLVLGGGIYVLSELERALLHRREMLPHLRRHFTDTALVAYGVGDANRALLAAGEKTSLRWVFVAAYFLGCALSVWILALQGCVHA